MMETENNNYKIEEYTNILSRINSQETIYYQMLILYITVFAAVLGFSDKISHALIPFILNSFLFFIILICNRHMKDQRISQSYIIVNFEDKISELNYFSFKNRLRVKENNKNLIKIAHNILHPLLILFYITLTASIYFSKEYLFNPPKTCLGFIYWIINILLVSGILVIYVRNRLSDISSYIKELGKEI